MQQKKKHMLAVLALFVAAGANAQTIYRCGNSYSQEPCPGASTVEAPPMPSAAETAAAREQAKREAQLADAMHADRAKLEAAQAAHGPATEKARSRGARGGPVKPVIFGHSPAKARDAKSAKKHEGATISRPASRAPAAAGTSAKGSPASR